MSDSGSQARGAAPRSGAPSRVGPAHAVVVAAQAKVNLRLRILAREASGYHQLETLFLRLELADTVRVRTTSGARSLDVAGVDAAAVGPTERNLAWRAAEIFAEATGMRGGFAIEIEKRIPIGGGLGGGSADAGAVLRCLDAMASTPLGEIALLSVAAPLGADVPFLTSTQPYVLAWGRGERMLSLVPPPSHSALLVVPAFGVNSAEAYGWLAEARELESATGDVRTGALRVGKSGVESRVISASARSAMVAEERGAESVLLQARALSTWDEIAMLAENDFEPVVMRRHPEIGEHLAALRALGTVVALMSGSGSTVFGVASAPDVEVGRELAQGSAGEGVRYVRTRTASRVEPVLSIE
jgi:4-diphosphocytidyl-2-C-methyl-D-erythritol kinase